MRLENKKKTEEETLRLEKKERIEQVKLKLNHELELAKIQSSSQLQGEVILSNNASNAVRRKFTLPKSEIRKLRCEIKD